MIDEAADPITVVRVRMADDPPGVVLICVGRRSTAARLAADAEPGGEVTDLGPAAMLLTQRWERKRDALGAGLVRVGVARDRDWLAWFLPSYPAEPPPGSPGHIASRN
jgi:hypothetical protein